MYYFIHPHSTLRRREIHVDTSDDSDASEDSDDEIEVSSRRHRGLPPPWLQIDSSVDREDHSSSDDDEILGIFNSARNVRPRILEPRPTSRTPSLPPSPPPPSEQRTESPVAGSVAPHRPRRRIQFGGFLNAEGTAIRSNAHGVALIGVLQLAQGHPDGIAGALGQNNRNNWISQHLEALFRDDGPLSSFVRVSVGVFQRHFSRANQLARTIYTRHHSTDTSGAAHEDVPEWARLFFGLFEEQTLQEERNPSAARVRDERRNVASTLVGRQAPLGIRAGNQPVEFRTETSGNIGTEATIRQVVGEVQVETVNNDALDNLLIEGRNDSSTPIPTQRAFRSGTRRRNVHLDFRAGRNDPSARFDCITQAYASLTRMSDEVVRSFSASIAHNTERVRPSPSEEMQSRVAALLNISQARFAVNQHLNDPSTASETDRQFYQDVLETLESELHRFRDRDGQPDI